VLKLTVEPQRLRYDNGFNTVTVSLLSQLQTGLRWAATLKRRPSMHFPKILGGFLCRPAERRWKI
jgi:hypothetical protein